MITTALYTITTTILYSTYANTTAIKSDGTPIPTTVVNNNHNVYVQ